MTCQGFCDLLSLVEKKMQKRFLIIASFFAAATVIFAPFLREEALSFLHLVVVNKKVPFTRFLLFRDEL